MPRLLSRVRPVQNLANPASGASSLANALPPELFKPRQYFPLPEAVPSWYAGHMHRAMQSLPNLLSRHPPPLVIEVRDARLPITSINPAFEDQLKKVHRANRSAKSDPNENPWESRRLVVYTRRDLIDRRIEEPLQKAFFTHGKGQQILFADTRVDADIRKIWQWLRHKARELAANPPDPPSSVSDAARPSKRLLGAFRHTTTPEEGVRVVVVGMPNVGKSSLLNALRRIGTGKGKVASTAPSPGHTRKLMGTVRITKDVRKELTKEEFDNKKKKKNRRRAAIEEEEEAKRIKKSKVETLDLSVPDNSRPQEPPIYVYDTPGIMVPYLGRGPKATERGIKLALAAGIKSSLFDTQGLADYLLFRLNLRHGFQVLQWWLAGRAGLNVPAQCPRPIYLTDLPMPSTAAREPTNELYSLLENVSAPGSLRKGGMRDPEVCADFMIHRWREGKLGIGELDVGFEELQNGAPEPLPDGTPFETVESRVDRLVREHFYNVRLAESAGVNKSPWRFRRDGEEQSQIASNNSESRVVRKDQEAIELIRSEMVSGNQVRKRAKADKQRSKLSKLKNRGIIAERGSERAKLIRDREMHRKWLIRTGKLKSSGKWKRIHRAK